MKTQKNTKKRETYEEWRSNKIREIQEAFDCSISEAVMIFLLQDISFKLSKYYEKD